MPLSQSATRVTHGTQGLQRRVHDACSDTNYNVQGPAVGTSARGATCRDVPVTGSVSAN